MTEIKLIKRYPNSRTEDIIDAYMRGWNDALDAVQNGKFIINDDRKTENSSEIPNNSKDEPQRGCDADCNEDCNECAKEAELWRAEQTEPQTDGFTKWAKSVADEYRDEPQTDCSWK